RLIDAWSGETERPYVRAGRTLVRLLRDLAPLGSPAPVAAHLGVLLDFVARYADALNVDDPHAVRQLRARGAIRDTLRALRDAYARFDDEPVDGEVVASLVRRWIDGQTFAPRAGESGVHVVDASSAALGSFEHVQLAGVMDGEWPERPRRNIFYSASVLRELGWPAETDRLDGERAAFADLLRLPASRLAVSVFTLEADALVSPSSLIDEVEHAGFETIPDGSAAHQIFDYEALTGEPIDHSAIGARAREWVTRRMTRLGRYGDRYYGYTDSHSAPAYSLSALERYQDCPFKFFASDVLKLEEAPEDESMLSPRARGRFIHEVFERFFEAWD